MEVQQECSRDEDPVDTVEDTTVAPNVYCENRHLGDFGNSQAVPDADISPANRAVRVEKPKSLKKSSAG